MNVWLLLAAAVSAAQRVVLFDNSDVGDFELMAPTNASGASGGRAYVYFNPAGTLRFRENGMPSVNATRVRDVRVPRTGTFSGISVPLRHIDRLPQIGSNDSFVIDVEYSFTLKDSADLVMQTGHGPNQLLMLSSDEDRRDDPRGLAVEYGGGSFAPLDYTHTNWSEPRAQTWRFDSTVGHGVDGAPGGVLVTMFRTKLVRSGLFRLRSRFFLHQNITPSATPTLQIDQFSISVANNPNYTGDLILSRREPTWSVWSLANASLWLRRDPLAPPRLSLFSTRTDFDVESILITAEPRSTAPSFNSTWLAPPPTPPPPPTTAGSRRDTTFAPVGTLTPVASTAPLGAPNTSMPTTDTPPAVTVTAMTNAATGATSFESGSTASGAVSTYTTAAATATDATTSLTVLSVDSSVPDDALLTDTSDASPSTEPGLSQAAIIAIAVIVPTCLLCAVLACVLSYNRGAKGNAKHGRAQVLSTTGVAAANYDKEFQSSREMHNIYGPAPSLPDAASVRDSEASSVTVVAEHIYTAAPPLRSVSSELPPASKSHYASTASEFTAGLPIDSNYQALASPP